MRAEKWVFTFVAIFFVVVAPLYWFIAREVIGTVALLLTLVFFVMISTYLSIQERKMDPRPEDRKDGEIIDGAGELGFFPASSIWPFWAAVTVAVMALGPVYGWWITLLGIGLGLWAVTGWAYQYYRDDYQH
ncbi:MAG: cytochrome c oxidase subunit 4 [Propionicimonas sp.]